LRHPVENDGDDHHADARFEAKPRFQTLNGLPDFAPQPLGPDHGGNDHHRQRQHDGLVDAGHDGGQGQWQFHLEEPLRPGGAEGVGGFGQRGGHLPDAQTRQSDGRRHGEDDGGENGRNRAQSEKGNGRNERDESRHGLHEIEHWHDNPGPPLVHGGQNAQGHAKQRGDGRGKEDQRDGGDGGVPQPEIPDQTEAEHGEKSDAPGPEPPGEQPEKQNERPGRQSRQDGIKDVDGRFQHGGHGLGQGREVIGQQVDAVLYGAAQGNAEVIKLHCRCVLCRPGRRAGSPGR